MWVRVLAGIALVVAASGGSVAIAASPQASPQIVTIDFVKAQGGERETLVRYYRANWARARATVLATRGIVGYRMLVSADTGSRWDVALETTYADSAAWSRRESAFAPVLETQGVTLINGKRRADVANIVESRTLIVDP